MRRFSNFLFATSGTLTLGAGITVHGTQGGQLGQGGVGLVLEGTVLADRAGQTITIRGSSVTNRGTLRAADGARLDVSPLANDGLLHADVGGTITVTAFTNAGEVRVEAGSSLFVVGEYWQTGGQTLLLGGVIDPTGIMRIDAGALGGFGTINANVINAGRVDLGAPIGTLQIAGTFEQTASGVLAIELGGATAGLFDRLLVSGIAILLGTLDISLSGGFGLTSGDTFEIVT